MNYNNNFHLTNKHLKVLIDISLNSIPEMVGKEYEQFIDFKELAQLGFIKVANFSSSDGEYYGDSQLTVSGHRALERLANE